MWCYGYLEDEKLAYEAKVYAHPSMFGIRDGRVSKLFVGRWNDDKGDWDTIYSYERGSIQGEIDEGVIDKILGVL